MLGVLDMITKLTLPILLITKLILRGSSQRKKIFNINFDIVFLKTIKHPLNRLLRLKLTCFDKRLVTSCSNLLFIPSLSNYEAL